MIYDNIPGIDAKIVYELYEDSEEVFLSVLRSWVNGASAYVAKLRGVSAETLKDYAVSVHGLKGSSAGIGAETIRAKAKELEMAAKAGNLAGVQADNEPFLKQVEAQIKTVQDWLKKYDASKA